MMRSQKVGEWPFLSFRRRPESRNTKDFWTPVLARLGGFAGVTAAGILPDVSGSMDRYVRFLMPFLLGLRGIGSQSEVYVFSTSLTRITFCILPTAYCLLAALRPQACIGLIPL
jgi:hypothetical protein